MDGTAHDGIHVAYNSLIQSFTECHDNSCARLTALQNSRVGRGPQVLGRNKACFCGFLASGQAVCWEKSVLFPSSSQVKLNEEMWASILLNKQGPRISREVEIVPGCAVHWWPVLHVLIIFLSHLGQVE